MKKRYIYMIGVIIIVVLFSLILGSIIKKPTSEKIIDYVKESGYSLNSSSSLYYKQISKLSKSEYNYYVNKKIDSLYEIYYFDPYNYKMIHEFEEYSNDILSSLVSNFDFFNNTLTYTYRVNYQNNNLIYKGSYDLKKDKFICNEEFSYGIDLNNNQIICDKIKVKILEFSLESLSFIPNMEFVDYIKEQKNS